MKAQKAKIKGNEGPKGKNERKWRPKKRRWPFLEAIFGWICLLEFTILERLGWQIWARGFLKTKGKEMKAQKAKMQGNEGPKGQNKRKWSPKRPKWKEMKAQKGKMKGNEGPKGQNERKWKPKRPKWNEMKAQKAKMKRNKAAPQGQK